MSARRVLTGLILTVAFVLCVWGCKAWWPRVVDDAYITFHYSQNLVDGYGPVFNPGERVEGYSSPSWMILSAGAIALGLDPVSASKWIGLFVTFCLVSLVYAAARREEVADPGAALAALLLGSSMVLQIWSVSGMETNLYALLFFAGLLSLGTPPTTTRGVLSASAVLVAAALTRPEGLLFWACGLLVVVATGNKTQGGSANGRARRAALYLLPGLALMLHFIWRLLYYGTALPNTYYAKTGGGLRMWQQGLHGLSIFLANPAHWIWIAAAIAGTAVGLARPGRRLKAGIMAGAVLLHLLYIVSVGDDGLRVHRFYVPVLAPLALLVAELFVRNESGRLRHSWPAVAGVAAVLATAAFSVRALHVDLLPRTLDGVLTYQQGNVKLGRHLARTMPSDTLIAVAAAGALPYYSRLPAIDMYGLNDARIARGPFPQSSRGRMMKWDNEYVLSREPRLIVINRGYFESGNQRVEAVLRNPAVLASSPMDRDLFQRIARDGAYALRPIRFDDGSSFFLFERRDDARQY